MSQVTQTSVAAFGNTGHARISWLGAPETGAVL